MAWDRLYLKNRIKSSMFQERGIEDGLLTDALIDEAIEEAIKIVVQDCNLNWTYDKIALRESVYAYPLPEDFLTMRELWYRNSQDYRYPLEPLSPEKFMDGIDPTDTASEPYFYTYPHSQGRVFHIYAGAAAIYDYVPDSYVTEATIRTLVDSGVKLGQTKDGRPIEPGDLVHNLTDDSYAYVEVLDTTTATSEGTCTPNTSNVIVEDTSKDFAGDGVEEGDIICKPQSDGFVTAYAFVSNVGTELLTYRDYQDPKWGSSGFVNGESYKVGRATEIRLSVSPPHPGLRSGGRNYFRVSDPKATMTGTTFTATRCTGSSPSGAEVGDIAIASGGSHGKVTVVATTYIDVNYWIGGQPTDAEEVSISECDRYQVESRFATEPVLWINPAPDTDDTIGQESLELLYNRMPTLPVNDTDLIPVPERYSRPLLHCARWQCFLEKGNTPETALDRLEQRYENDVRKFMGDIYKPTRGKVITPWRNRSRGYYRRNRYAVASYDPSSLL